MTAPGRDGNDALAALERLLLRHKVISPEQATAAARLITGDPSLVFPPPRPPPPAPPAAAPEEPPAQDSAAAPPSDNASPPGSEAP